MKNKLCPQLMPVLHQLQREGFTVYTYQNNKRELESLFWYENGRVLNIQADMWRSPVFPDSFNLSVSYVPSERNGSGCRLSDDDGVRAGDALKYRNSYTWVRGAVNYKSMQQFLDGRGSALKYAELDSDGYLKD